MGGKNSNPFKEVLEDYKVTEQIEEFNLTYLIHKQSNREYLLRTLTYNDERDFKRNMQIQQGRKCLDKTQHLTMLTRFESGKQDNLCSHFFKIYSLWEYPHRSLSQELEERRIQRRKFQQKQLWSILASTVLGMSILQKNSIRHQCLSTKTLLLSNQGILKVADPITTEVTSNFQALYNNRKLQQLYLSPEQCSQLSSSNSVPSSSFKNDVYSMGMIMLECGLLRGQIDCYKDDCGRIDYQVLLNSLNRFGMQYSESIRSIVQYMLRKDPKQRPDWIQLERQVRRVDSIQNHTNQYRKSEFDSFPRQTDYNQYSHQPTQRNLNNGMVAYVPRNTRQQIMSNNQAQGYSSSNIHRYQQRRRGNIDLEQNANTTRNQPFSKEQRRGLSIQPNQQNDNTVSKRKTINIGGRDTQSKNKQSGMKIYTTQKVNQYTPVNRQPNINMDTFGAQKLNSNFIGTPYDFIRSPTNYTQQNSFNATNITQGKNNNNIENNYKTQFGNIYAPTGYKTNNQIARNPEYTTVINRNYQPYQQSNYTFKNQKYQNLIGYQRKPEKVDQKQIQKNSYVSATMSSGNQIANDFTSNNYNAASYGIQGVTTTNSISGPHAIGSFDYGKSYNFSGKPTQQKQGYNGSQSYQAFIAQKKASIDQKRQSIQKNFGLEQKTRRVQSQEPLQNVIEHFKQGSRYEGSKLNGMRHGNGKFYYQDGGMYEGEWKYNKMHGYGALYYQSGKIAYEGEWYDDQFQGIGKLYNQNPQKLNEPFDYHNFDLIDEYWVYFDGQFVEDLKHGKGKLVFSNGQYLIGRFDRDMVQGQGKFYCENGEFIDGYWDNNQLTQQF